MKKISMFVVAFMFSFLCFSLNVNAYDYSNIDEYFNYYDNISDDILINVDNYLTSYFNDLGYDKVICVDNGINSSYFYFVCKRFNILKFSDYSNLYFSGILEKDIVFYYYFNEKKFVEYFSGSNSGLWIMYDLIDSYLPFWLSDSFFIDSTSNDVIIDDDVYSNISDNLKKYYNFQNYIVEGMPFYSIYNLRFGNWKGYSSSVDLIYCYDGVCNDSVEKNLVYKYGSLDEVIDLSNDLDLKSNGYSLDLTRDYSFVANSKATLNVYYYSTDVDYYVNYYFDGELQKDISYKKSASVGSIITLKDIDKVKEDIYFLEEDKDYSIKLCDVGSNVIDIYYVSYDMNYNVNVYLDDIYYQSHSYTDVAKRGSEVVLENLEKTINIFILDEREYKLSVSENSQLNYINVYYYSDNYNTKYQDIDTTGKFYISFHWTDIKDLFNLKGNYTQTEQFIIVYVVNILFYVIVCIFSYFGLKMLYKLFSFVKMF